MAKIVSKNGDRVNVTFTVVNSGGSLDTNVTLTVTIPAGLSYVEHDLSGSQGVYNPSTDVWTIGDIPAQESRAITITFNVEDIDLAPYSIVGVVAGDNTDPDMADNTITATINADTTSPVAGAIDNTNGCICGYIGYNDTLCNKGITEFREEPSSLVNIDTIDMTPETGRFAVTLVDPTLEASFEYSIWCIEGVDENEVSKAIHTIPPLFTNYPAGTVVTDNGNGTYTVQPPGGAPTFDINTNVSVTVDDSTTLNLRIQGDGSSVTPYDIDGDVIISPAAGNGLSDDGNGLYVGLQVTKPTPGYVQIKSGSTTTAFKEGWTEVAYTAPDLTFTYPDGSTFSVNIPALIAANEFTTSLIVSGNDLIYTDENNSAHVVAIGNVINNLIAAASVTDLSDVPSFPNDGNAYVLRELNGALTWVLLEDIHIQSFSIEEQGAGSADDVLRITDNTGNNYDVNISDLSDAINQVSSTDTTNVSLSLAAGTLTLTDSAGDTVSEDLTPLLAGVESDIADLQSDVTTLQSDVSTAQSDITTLQGKVVTSIAFTGTTNKTLTLTFQDATTLTADFTDLDSGGGAADGNDYVSSMSVFTTGGESYLRLTRTDGVNIDLVLSDMIDQAALEGYYKVSADANNDLTIGTDGWPYYDGSGVNSDTTVTTLSVVNDVAWKLRITNSDATTIDETIEAIGDALKVEGHVGASADANNDLTTGTDGLPFYDHSASLILEYENVAVHNVPEAGTEDPIWIVPAKYNGWDMTNVRLVTNFTGSIRITEPSGATQNIPVTSGTVVGSALAIALATDGVFKLSVPTSGIATGNSVALTFKLEQ